MNRSLTLQTPHGPLHGHITTPDTPRGLVLLARAHHVMVDDIITANLANRGYAILSMELLSSQEMHFADATQNVPRLAQRLIDILDLIRHDPAMQELPLAIFANGDLTPAAIRAAAQRDAQVGALACHGGIIDRAGLQSLKLLAAPLLMLFDADDPYGRPAFQRAKPYLAGIHESHTLQPLEDPVPHVAAWFSLHLAG
jgi:hypothetical protein